MKARIVSFTGLAAICAAAPICASPYEVTNLSAADAWEIRIASAYETAGGERFFEGPVFDLTAPLAPGLEMSATFGGGYVDAPGAARWERLDSAVAFKYEIAPLSGRNGFGVTTEPTLVIPTGSQGFGDGEFRLEAPLIAGWARGRWEVRGLVSYAHSLESREDEFGVGAAVEYAVSEDLSLGGEIASSHPGLGFREHESHVNVGFVWGVSKAIELQGRIGRTIANTAGPPGVNMALFLQFGF